MHKWLAVAQMQIEYLTGKLYSQDDLLPWYSLRYWGVNAHGLEKILEGKTSINFKVKDIHSEKEGRELIYKELIENGRPLLIGGTTVHANGNKSPGNHWLLINGVKIDGKQNKYDLHWVYIMDPLYHSKWESEYRVIKPFHKISEKDLFHIHWLPNPSGVRQAVK